MTVDTKENKVTIRLENGNVIEVLVLSKDDTTPLVMVSSITPNIVTGYMLKDGKAHVTVIEK